MKFARIFAECIRGRNGGSIPEMYTHVYMSVMFRNVNLWYLNDVRLSWSSTMVVKLADWGKRFVCLVTKVSMRCSYGLDDWECDQKAEGSPLAFHLIFSSSHDSKPAIVPTIRILFSGVFIWLQKGYSSDFRPEKYKYERFLITKCNDSLMGGTEPQVKKKEVFILSLLLTTKT